MESFMSRRPVRPRTGRPRTRRRAVASGRPRDELPTSNELPTRPSSHLGRRTPTPTSAGPRPHRRPARTGPSRDAAPPGASRPRPPTARRSATARRRSARSPPRPNDERRPGGGGSPSLRWVPWVVLALVAVAFLVSSLAEPRLVEGRAHLLAVREARCDDGNVEEHRVQQVDRHHQRRVRRAASTASDEFTELGPEGRPPAVDARRSSRRRTSTSSTSTRAATSSATSSSGSCRSCSSSGSSCG